MSDPTHPPDLNDLRRAIEEVDRQLLSLIKERMRISESVAAVKLAAAYPFRDQHRVEQILQSVRRASVELALDPHQMEEVFRLLTEMSITHQQGFLHHLEKAPLRVAYQGVEGSFSHLAAQKRYGQRKGGALLSGHETFRLAVEALRNGSADTVLLPIENSTAGSINETYDLLAEGDLKITAEVISEVNHCLLALPGATKEQLHTVLSHPQALMQCENYLHRCPWIKPQAVFDTAGAARQVKQRNDPAVGAIASSTAARVVGLEVLEHDIQTASSNFTRFVEIGRESAACPADVPCKTSLMLCTGHTPGALGEVLTEFSRRNINLTKLESRPNPSKPWTPRFYLDIEGHVSSVPIGEALERIRQHTTELQVLGSYPLAPSLPEASPQDEAGA